jgi:hypothetical protein
VRGVLPLAALALWALPTASASAQAAPAQGAPAIQSVIRFQGVTVVRDAARTDSVRVDIRDWSLAPGMRAAALEMPFRGLMIVELRGGRVTTIIDGRRAQRTAGEIWSVPAGGTMQLETGDDMATLQITVVGG